MGQFDDDTAVRPAGDGFRTQLSGAWSIGSNPNGGYAVQPVLRALCARADRPDPASLTVHYLRPALADVDGEITATVVRAGKRATNVTGSLAQEGADRLTVMAVLTDLTGPATGDGAPDVSWEPAAPDIPPPERCIDRAELGQGVDLPLLSRVDVRVVPPRDDRPVVEGWVRLADGTAPTSRALVLFADAFPPAVHAVVGRVGWVPTLELTVHVRRRPDAGWVQARIDCDDIAGGRLIETGTLWDESGAVVARVRQLGLLLTRA